MRRQKQVIHQIRSKVRPYIHVMLPMRRGTKYTVIDDMSRYISKQIEQQDRLWDKPDIRDVLQQV